MRALYLDYVEDADPDLSAGVIAATAQAFNKAMEATGARKVRRADGWVWLDVELLPTCVQEAEE